MSSPAAFHEVFLRIDLIGSINGYINAIDSVQCREGNAAFSCQVFGLKGGGNTDNIFQVAACEAFPQVLNGKDGCRARAETDDAVGLYALGCRSANRLFEVCHKVTIGHHFAHSSLKGLDEFKDQSFDFVITVCDQAKESCPSFLYCQWPPVFFFCVP
jgi:hypothetical protein